MKNRIYMSPESLLLQTTSDVTADNDTVISLVRLQGQLLQRLDSLLSQLLNLSGEDSLGIDSRVNTVGLDGDDDTSLVLQEQVGVQSNNTSLIWLSHIGENSVDHTDQHTVLLWVTSIVNDRNDVRSLLGHADQLSTWSVRELNGVNHTLWANNVGNVGNRGTGGSTQVQDLLAWSNTQLIDTTHDTGSQLGSERVPHTVLNLGSWGTLLFGWLVNRDSLLSVDRLTWGHVSGDQQVLLTSGNENTSVSVWLDDNLGTTSSTTSGTTSATSGTTTSATSGTASSATTSTAETASGTATATAETTSGTTSSATWGTAESTTGSASATSRTAS